MSISLSNDGYIPNSALTFYSKLSKKRGFRPRLWRRRHRSLSPFLTLIVFPLRTQEEHLLNVYTHTNTHTYIYRGGLRYLTRFLISFTGTACLTATYVRTVLGKLCAVHLCFSYVRFARTNEIFLLCTLMNH